MEQPDIYLGSLRIQEPITTLTDVLVAVLCAWLAWKLKKQSPKHEAKRFLSYYFAFLALAFFFGGILGHGFLYLFDKAGKLPGWYTSMFAMMFIERSAITQAKGVIPPRLHKFLMRMNIVELVALMSMATISLNFLWVELHAAYGLLVIVTPLQFIILRKRGDSASKMILYSLVVLGIAMVIYNWKLAPYKWFNHADLAHTIMGISAYLLYLGGRRIQENRL